ncbi:MAG: hypothetical protein LUC35_07190, partial [Clostridiales bacterium]|nr:hypothetical protein [Clostridiales bacterium]
MSCTSSVLIALQQYLHYTSHSGRRQAKTRFRHGNQDCESDAVFPYIQNHFELRTSEKINLFYPHACRGGPWPPGKPTRNLRAAKGRPYKKVQFFRKLFKIDF